MQADKALHAMEWPRRQVNSGTREGEELALRQMISGIIIPEWQEADKKKKNETIAMMRLWTGAMMNWARIQMK
eukprot:1170856-Pleurochrysis_carterae.AAC.1